MESLDKLSYEADRVINLFKQMESTFNEKKDPKLTDANLKVAISAGIQSAHNRGVSVNTSITPTNGFTNYAKSEKWFKDQGSNGY